MNGACRGEHSHMTFTGYASYSLDRGTYDPQHPSARIHFGEIVLLDSAQSLCRSRVARQNNESAPFFEQCVNRLEREAIDNVERARAVGRTCVVAQEYVVVFRQHLTNAAKYGQSAIPAVEDPDCTFAETSQGLMVAIFSFTSSVTSSPVVLFIKGKPLSPVLMITS